eukprot:Tamp_28844.p2 GENE.Tamp_28844~~Tamp_28844.p2  ORF type:complete len:101 (-),score=9.31 Tamp_28844:70-372(-)
MSLPRQACPSFDMVVLLRGSQAISYDNVHETHTPGDKWDFLRKYGYPSTFHKCWHSPDKNKVLLKRSNNSPFLMAPIASFLVGYLQLRIPTLHCHQVRCD